MDSVHIKFVVTAIDKATENVTLQLYTPLLSKEPGLGQNITGIKKSYIQANETNNQAISGHSNFLKITLDLQTLNILLQQVL